MSAVTTIDLRKKTDVPAQVTHQELTTPKLSPIELSKTLGRIFRRWDDPGHRLFSSSEELRHFRKNVARYAWRRHKKKVTRAQARAQSAPSTKPSRARHNATRLNQRAVQALIRNAIQLAKEAELDFSSRKVTKEVALVLTHLNREPDFEATIPTSIKRPVRPSSAATSSRDIKVQRRVLDSVRALQRIPANQCTPEQSLLFLALSMGTLLGMEEEVIRHTLLNLSSEHLPRLNTKRGPHHWFIGCLPGLSRTHPAHYRLKIPNHLRRLLRACRQSPVPSPATSSQQADVWWFSSDATLDLNSPLEARATHLDQLLVTGLSQLLDSQASRRTGSSASLKNARSLLRHAFRCTTLLGPAPLWSQLLRRYPLPVCSWRSPWQHDESLFFSAASRPTSGTSSASGAMDASEPEDIETDLHTPELLMGGGDRSNESSPSTSSRYRQDQLSTDWYVKAGNQLYAYITELEHEGLITPRGESAIQRHDAITSRYAKKLIHMLGEDSYPLWILLWLSYQSSTQGNKASTLRTYLSRLTPTSLMMLPDIPWLTLWDGELMEAISEQLPTQKGWDTSTSHNFFQTFNQFISFCQGNDRLTGIPPVQGEGGRFISTLRTHLIMPHEAEHLTRALSRRRSGLRRSWLIAFLLGYYGGLRAGEVMALTLHDVIINQPGEDGPTYCYVEIHAGKTANARRSVPLHLLISPELMTLVREWIDRRRESFAGQQRLKNIALLGPESSPLGYSRESLLTPLMAWARESLRGALTPGLELEDIHFDFHLLRHNAISWLVLRLYSDDYPQLLDRLSSACRGHWSFTPAAQANCRRAVYDVLEKDAKARGHRLELLAKLIGHRNSQTLTYHYTHVLGEIHGEVLLELMKRR
ncbi:site-specific integrase [Cobetia sp. Ld8]|uniref:site-specific integrase n=1 Tax=Cobetia sp. Ld8 TaxID=649154 RepID=UPI00103B9F53|nr:site-specific integrase [Halomonas sp. GDM18]